MTTKKHPGFKTVQEKLNPKQGLTVLAKAAERAGMKPLLKNPRLKKISGVEK